MAVRICKKLQQFGGDYEPGFIFHAVTAVTFPYDRRHRRFSQKICWFPRADTPVFQPGKGARPRSWQKPGAGRYAATRGLVLKPVPSPGLVELAVAELLALYPKRSRARP